VAAAHRTLQLIVFEYLQRFRRIVVTGPQRSGTTICARMVAGDLGWRMIDETDRVGTAEREKKVGHLSHVDSLRQVLVEDGVVVQAPSAAAFCHQLPPEVAIVFMIRPVAEILRSEERIAWRGNSYELKLLGQTAGHSCEIKYANWQWQRPLIRHAFEVEYRSLQAHPLWVDPELRRSFGKKQTATATVARSVT
jgi:hypothetical protein